MPAIINLECQVSGDTLTSFTSSSASARAIFPVKITFPLFKLPFHRVVLRVRSPYTFHGVAFGKPLP